jgi:hypothetical protein
MAFTAEEINLVNIRARIIIKQNNSPPLPYPLGLEGASLRKIDEEE